MYVSRLTMGHQSVRTPSLDSRPMHASLLMFHLLLLSSGFIRGFHSLFLKNFFIDLFVHTKDLLIQITWAIRERWICQNMRRPAVFEPPRGLTNHNLQVSGQRKASTKIYQVWLRVLSELSSPARLLLKVSQTVVGHFTCCNGNEGFETIWRWTYGAVSLFTFHGSIFMIFAWYTASEYIWWCINFSLE